MADLMQSVHSEETGHMRKNTEPGGRMEGAPTPGRGSKVYIFKCKNQTDKIFVNIKFLVCFSFCLFGVLFCFVSLSE